ncbi:MAG: hypothetical protein OEW04_03415 [Nitrospirota bacterium]|nr:hypothetical protein [Nitrospirota bacterium]
MTQHRRHPDDSDKRDNTHSGDRKTEGDDDIICRCKEVSKKTFPEMIRLMISDLAFWKKTKARE